MTRNELAKIRILKVQIKSIQDELNGIPFSENYTYTSDTYKDYRSGQGVVKVVSGYGLSKKAYARQQRLKGQLIEKLDELQDRLKDVERWLDNVEDEEMAAILRLKYRNGLKDWEIGEELGYSRQAIGMKLKKFFAD